MVAAIRAGLAASDMNPIAPGLRTDETLNQRNGAL
jgi:hypothetical protein